MTNSKYILPKGYLSASSISTMLKCPMQFYFRYVEDIVKAPTAALVTGSVAHKSFETYYNMAIENDNNRLTPKEAGEMAAEEFTKYLSDTEVDMTQREKDDAKPEVVNVVSNYVNCIGKHIMPVATEKEYKFEMPCGVDILGYIDLEHKINGNEKNIGIVDYKITGKKWSMSTLRNSLQFMLYSLMTGIEDVRVHNITKTAFKPLNHEIKEDENGVTAVASNMQILHNVFDIQYSAHLNRIVESVAKIITSGLFAPCDPSSWCCTPEWCGYWNLCRGKKS